MPHIIPIKELKNTSTISEKCHSSNEPIFITKNGYGDMVLMSIELFEKTQNMSKLLNDIELSEQQIKQDETKNAKTALVEISEKNGV